MLIVCELTILFLCPSLIHKMVYIELIIGLDCSETEINASTLEKSNVCLVRDRVKG